MMRREWLRGLIVFALLMAGFALKGLLIAPPLPRRTPDRTEFNTPRAIARLQRILGDQRPIRSTPPPTMRSANG